MKKSTFLFLLLPMVTVIYAQNYEIDFTATGAADVIDSIIVENLTQGSSIILSGDDVLRINIPENGIKDDAISDEFLRIFPNPMENYSELQFYTGENGLTDISVFDLSGKLVASLNLSLDPGRHSCVISGLNQGIYLVVIRQQSSLCSAKLISHNNLNIKPCITYISSTANRSRFKNTGSEVQIDYQEGDVLKLTGMSGNLSTIITLIPAESATMTFDFIECRDADYNYYPVVKIGDHYWMGKELKSTRYNDSTSIPLIMDTSWANLITPAYCWYDDDTITNKNVYGALYNWFVVDTASNGGRNVCPSGWHVATNEEWTELADYAGGASIAGGKLKETGTSHWTTPNQGATNETGFTALPAGWKGRNNEYMDMGIYGCWWTSDNVDDGQAQYREMDYNNPLAWSYPWYKQCGFSMRCVKDEE